ncbi:MAG TPA: tetratricopeptide repeat protein [Gaiellales bacterium]|nr:tetratricopeptide repeat protein [Gaiellales bacterium]
MLIRRRRLSPLVLALPAVAAAAALALSAGGTSGSRPHRAQVAIPYASAAPRTLTTPQLVARYRAEAAASPHSAQAADNLALAELQMAREDGDPTWYTRADALFRHALALAPGDFTALAGQGSLALSRHDFTGALALGQRALAIDPSSPFAMGVVVDANVELGRYAAARSALERLLDQRPDLASYSRVSYFLELHGRTAAARRALVQATQSGAPSGENTAWAYLYLGNLDFNHGRYAAAARSYRAAIHTDPGFLHARAAQAKLAAARGDYRKAIAAYSAVVARYPLPAYVIALGDVYRAAGRPAAARRQYALVRAEERLYAANGVNVDVELALFDDDHGGDVAGALARMRALARIQPSVTAEDALAWTLFKAGHARAALAAADRALRLGTRDSSFLYHRGAIEASLGMRGPAARDLRAALSLNPRFSLLYAPDARRLLRRVGR